MTERCKVCGRLRLYPSFDKRCWDDHSDPDWIDRATHDIERIIRDTVGTAFDRLDEAQREAMREDIAGRILLYHDEQPNCREGEEA